MTRTTLNVIALVAALTLLAGCQPNALLRKQAREALEREQLPLAEQKLTLAIEQHPEDWQSQELLGELYMKQGRPLDAQAAFELALGMVKTKEHVQRLTDRVAESLYAQQQYDALITFCQRAAQDARDRHAFARLGKYLAKTGDADAAELAYRKAARFAKDDDEQIYLEIATFYEQLGNRDKAIIALRQAYGVNPRSVKVHRRLRAMGLVPDPTIALPRDGDDQADPFDTQ